MQREQNEERGESEDSPVLGYFCRTVIAQFSHQHFLFKKFYSNREIKSNVKEKLLIHVDTDNYTTVTSLSIIA